MNSLVLTPCVANSPPTPPARATLDHRAAVMAVIRELVDGAGIILNPSQIRRADAAPMEIPASQTLNTLLSNTIAQGNLKQIPADLLGKPQVIEAVVLSNSPLLQNTTGGQEPGYRVAVQWQNRILQLLSGSPLNIGARLRLQINAQGEITLLASNPAAPNLLPDALSRPALALQMALRENLPLAQPLNLLVPLLQKLAGGANALPEPLAKAINQLLHSLPRAEQLQNPNTLKQLLNTSGALLEARMAGADAQGSAQIAASDLKGQIVMLLALLRRLGFAAPDPAKAPLPSDDLVYSPRPNPHGANTTSTKNDSADSTEALLNQLGKLLGGGLARIQMNQLDAASARHLASADNPQPMPTWVFELPLPTQRGADNLQLRIEQRQQQREGRQRSQWTVNIGFDLHELGKLAATLTIVERSVSATLWSEREAMHRAVRTEIDHLRAGLEQAGVKVTEVSCRLGLPPQRNTPLSQQLVDVLT